MIFLKKTRVKPLYKQFLKIQEDVQDRKKWLTFKKEKWQKMLEIELRKLEQGKKFKDQFQYVASKYPSWKLSYSRCYKNTLITNKKFKLFYGGLLKKFFKKQVKAILKRNYKNLIFRFLKSFEHRLDVILYRSYFCNSVRKARQLIIHKKISVNKKVIKVCSYKVNTGDLITVDSNSFNFIKYNIKTTLDSLLPPKHLLINYKTLQIIFGDFKNTNLTLSFLYYLNFEKITTSYYRN